MTCVDDFKAIGLLDEVKFFWEREGALKDGRAAYVKSFKSAVEADECARTLAEAGVTSQVQIEQELTDNGYTAIRLDGEQFDQAYG